MGLAIVVMLIGASICASVAANKHRSIGGWFVAGALIPLIAVIMICSLPPEPAPAAIAGAAPPAA